MSYENTDIDPIALIKRRRSEIDAKRSEVQAMLARLDAESAALAKEEEELAVAERVFGRLSGQVPASTTVTPAPALIWSSAVRRIRHGGAPRPDGIPSTPAMADMVLMEAEARGLPGLTGREIADAIAAKWWPGVADNLILPTLYRLVSKGQWFKRDSNLFKRIESGTPGSRSATNGAVATDGEAEPPI